MMKKKSNKMILILSILFIFFLLLFCVFCLNKTKKDYDTLDIKFESRIDKLEKFDSNGLQKIGWLQVQGTNIDLPIISPFFLVEPEYSFGWITNKSMISNNRKVLVGHNVLNVSKEPMVNDSILTDFEDLMSFVYYDFAKDNMYLSYTENGIDKIYAIYGIGFYDYYYDDGEGFDDSNDTKKYIKKVKENSIYKYDIDVKEDDEIITVKTCTRFFGIDEKQQFQIDARLVRDDEKTIKYGIKKTKLFKKYNLKDRYKKLLTT